ncbi:SpoIIE family protein phosphatase [Streptomyces sp. NPDC051976]|uniref:ATP-binding SpoIIE family protein phosphatase n=1 Tax=Streptomyces sp. NPDC051976 TaxID=3154947 RepID=UPI0034366719
MASVDVEAFVSDIARGLQSRRHQLAEAFEEGFRKEAPHLWQYQDLVAVGTLSIPEHIATVLDALQRGFDTSEIKTPPAGIEVARQFARNGKSISEMTRLCFLSYTFWLDLFTEEIFRRTRDPELIKAVAVAAGRAIFEIVDRTAEQTVAAYVEERDLRLQRRLIVINEASTRIGTTLDMARTAQELADVGNEHLADLVTVDLLDSVIHEEDRYPVPGPTVLRRIAQRSVLDDCPDSAVALGQTHSYPEGSYPARALTREPVQYRITPDDVAAWWAASAERARAIGTYGIHSVLVVPLRARGIILGVAQFFRHQTAEAFDDNDLLLAQEITSRAAVNIDNARRYTHERSIAATLQRSLLPQQAMNLVAVETASRYLPAGSRGGVGGDWYDVIPLSGGRVALVVGDVVGRGLHASATMGRLRTAVRAFADIDLMPDELLTHLDDVVIRLQKEEAGQEDEISATCLYAVYDPVSRLCTVASAGHVPPAVITPATSGSIPSLHNAVDFPDLPIGPPLGLGGLPFETTEFEVAEGSVLVLYTDGLIEAHGRDVDVGLNKLRSVLAEAPSSLEETCDILLSTLPERRRSDDIAFLLARTRSLDSGHVASWDLPSDPAVVAEARASAADQLAAWGLEELAFTTELVVSELVTNAIRYGKPPIQLRMILQSTLTCEVSDASSTAPHLRRARVFDEGGRGLLLVAQLCESWGTRYTHGGKVIWAEQALLPEAK